MQLTTKRWFPLPESVQTNPKIRAYAQFLEADDMINGSVCAGRRSYKTELAKRSAVRYALAKPNRTVIIGAPTVAQVKKIFWKDLKDLVPPKLLARKPMEVALEIHFVNGSKIMLMGVIEQAARFEGILVDRVYIDEAQLIPNLEEVYSSTFEPGLTATDGKMILIGRPRGKGFYWKCIKKGQDVSNKDWLSFHWHSKVVLTKQQIERAKSNVSKSYFDREYGAEFTNSISMSYDSYSDMNHDLPREIIDQPIDFKIPMVLSFDFNYSECPMTTLIGQFREVRVNNAMKEILYIHEVLSNPFTNTSAQMDHIKSAINKYGQNWEYYSYAVHGDYTGKYKQSSSNYTDYDLIQIGLKGSKGIQEFLTPCKSIRNATNAVNNRLQSADGNIWLYINKHLCQPLLDDFDNLSWDEDSTGFLDIGSQYDHAAKALNYLVEYHFPLEEIETLVA